MAAYEVLLLNTAIPQIQAAQSGDTYVVPRDIAFSAALTLSAGTANGVPYLNASKVLTTGSALTFDGTNLLNDQSTASPIGIRLRNGSTSTAAGTRVAFEFGGTTTGYIGNQFDGGDFNTQYMAAQNHIWYRGVSDAMILTSTGLGIGTNNPAQKLDVRGGSIVVDAAAAGLNPTVFFDHDNFASGTRNYIQMSRVTEAMLFGVANSDRMTLDSSGNLGLGVTPSAWQANGKALEFSAGAIYSYLSGASGEFDYAYNAYFDGGWKYKASSSAASLYSIQPGIYKWFTAPSGTANSASVTSGASYTVVALGSSTLAQWQAFFNDSSNNPLTVTPTLGQVLTGNATGTLLGGGLVTQNISFTQAMTLLANGNLGIGETNPAAKLQVAGGNIRLDNNQGIEWGGNTNFIYGNNSTNILVFTTSNTERARITSGGYFKASFDGSYIDATGTYHEFTGTTANGYTLRVRCTNPTPANHYISDFRFTAASPNNATALFIECRDSTAARFELRSDGGLANYQANDANLSDQRVKKDIVAAPSYWDKIKGIEIVHFKYKDQTHDDNNVGVIAQQVEQVAPEFVDQNGWGDTPEDGVPLKSIYTSDMHHAAIKALQEAMARIEKLEAEVAALKGA